jgi:CDP-diacylglycerol--glycerol-3-phosphate 3-phosphatidyltransferase
MTKIKKVGRQFIVHPIVNLLIGFDVHPNVITLASLFLAIIAFLFYRAGTFWLGAIFLFLCGMFDAFDGEIARRTNRITKIGSFLDSTIDRVNEFIIYCGLFSYYYGKANYALVWVFCALFGSMMVSYTRARGEGLGISPQVGIFERFTRFTLLVIGSFFNPQIMIYVLVILTIGTLQTTIHRIIFVSQQSSQH